MILHTVNKSPFEKNALESCINHAQPGSAILLFEDGVYGAVKGSVMADKMTQAVLNFKVYVLGPDLAARGLSQDKLVDNITVIDYGGFVDLTVENDTVQAWL
jgi:tRNA 2-thiouridine synthesizing protein B